MSLTKAILESPYKFLLIASKIFILKLLVHSSRAFLVLNAKVIHVIFVISCVFVYVELSN